jgi:acyl carrier protein
VGSKTKSEILEIIQKALNVNDLQVTMESSFENIPEWDSLAQINIIVALDTVLGGRISELQEMATASSVRKIVVILTDNGFIANE